jgi:acetyl esterase/lipase
MVPPPVSRSFLAVLAALCGLASGCGGAREPVDGGGGNPAGCEPIRAEVQRDLPYAERGDAELDARTRFDVYPPDEEVCGRPMVVWVHGGAWSVGDRSNQLEEKIPFFRRLGVVFISIGYRLTTETNGVQHPDHVEDVAEALAHVRSRATELGGDPDRIALVGHSAGAHLVALAATNGRFLARHELAPSDVACVASFDSEYTVSEIVARDPAYELVFGSDPAGWEDASPAAHVGPGLPPFLLACRGSAGRVQQCEALAAALRNAGGEATTIDASSLSHEEVNQAIGDPDDDVITPALEAFLGRCLL